MGKVEGIIKLKKDIKQAEKALQDFEAGWCPLMEHLLCNIVLFDLDGTIFFTNFLWSPLEERASDSIFDYTSIEYRKLLHRNMDNVLHTGEPETFEVPLFISLKEPMTWWLIRLGRITQNGNIVGFAAIGTDITKYKHVEDNLMQGRKSLAGIFESSPAAIIVADLNINIIDCNEVALNLIGFPMKKELIGKGFLDLIVPRDRQRAARNIEKVLKEGVIEDIEYNFMTKDDREFTGELSICDARGQFGNSTSFVATIKDITERKQTAEMGKMAVMGRMAASIAHEINNPLAGIRNSFLLIKDAIPEEHPYYKYVGMIEREIHRVTRIVRQMLNLYRTKHDLHEFIVEQVINDTIMMLEAKCRENNVKIEFDNSKIVTAISMQEAMFPQILYNVILNAIEASPNGGIVKVTAIVDRNVLKISVSDQGSGIPEEMRSSIFEPFFTTKSEGLGLGLSITKSIVELRRGTIDYKNKPDKGVVFNITLPF